MQRIINIIITLCFLLGLVIVALPHISNHADTEADHIADLWLNKDCFVGEPESLDTLLLHYGHHLESRFLELAVNGPGDSALRAIERDAERHFDHHTASGVADSGGRQCLKFQPGERNGYLSAIRSREILAHRIRAINALTLIGSENAAKKLRAMEPAAQPALKNYIGHALRAIERRGNRN